MKKKAIWIWVACFSIWWVDSLKDWHLFLTIQWNSQQSPQTLLQPFSKLELDIILLYSFLLAQGLSPGIYTSFSFRFFLIEAYFIYNIILVSGIQ